MVNYPALSSVKRIILSTHDAHDLYKRFGFETLAEEGEEARQMMQLLRATGDID